MMATLFPASFPGIDLLLSEAPFPENAEGALHPTAIPAGCRRGIDNEE
jgi:hypothetical protein